MPEYAIAAEGGELRQSEIISGLTQIQFYDFEAGENVISRYDYAIVLSQDCDLVQDFRKRAAGEETDLNCVLLFEAQPFESVPTPEGVSRKRIAGNQVERYHVLNAVPVELDLRGLGIPQLIIDFKFVFAILPKEIERQCSIQGEEGARRRCRLESPYREHLQNRMGYFLQRVALPDKDDA